MDNKTKMGFAKVGGTFRESIHCGYSSMIINFLLYSSMIGWALVKVVLDPFGCLFPFPFLAGLAVGV